MIVLHSMPRPIHRVKAVLNPALTGNTVQRIEVMALNFLINGVNSVTYLQMAVKNREKVLWDSPLY